MGVSLRNSLRMGLVCTALALPLAGIATAGGGGGQGPHLPGHTIGAGPGIVLPGASTQRSSDGCCNLPKGPNVILPGPTVSGPHIAVQAPHVSVAGGSLTVTATATASASAAASAGASATGQTTTFLSGGGAFFAPQATAASTVSSLNVTGAEDIYYETVTETVSVEEEICVEEIREIVTVRAIQAMCLDDTGHPHPASQVNGARHVPGQYAGEIFRCMAGTSMQVTIGEVEGDEASFAEGQTLACRRGEALVRSRTGRLSCAPQIPQRDCNERSLLRQYGPGIKLMEMRSQSMTCVPQTRTRLEPRTYQVERRRAAEPVGPIVLDGGVGQSVY